MRERRNRWKYAPLLGPFHRNVFGRELSDPCRARHVRNFERTLAGPFRRQESRKGSPRRQPRDYFRVFLRRQKKQDHLSPKISTASSLGFRVRRSFRETIARSDHSALVYVAAVRRGGRAS